MLCLKFRVEESCPWGQMCLISIRPFSWGVSLYCSAMWGVFCLQLQEHIIFPAETNEVWRKPKSVRSCISFSCILWHYWLHVEIKCRKAEKHQKVLLRLRNLERAKNWIFEGWLFQGFPLGQAADTAPLTLSWN